MTTDQKLMTTDQTLQTSSFEQMSMSSPWRRRTIMKAISFPMLILGQKEQTTFRSEIDDDRSNIANFKFRANEYVVTVEKTNNYEGNIISYVDLRTKGTDDIPI